MIRIILASIILNYSIIYSVKAVETIGLKDIKINKINDNLYVHISYLQSERWTVSCNGVIYISDNEAIILDSPVSDSASLALIKWMEKKGFKTIAIIPTHWHIDCLGGLNEFHKRNIPSYALESTCVLAQKHEVVVPQNCFADSLTLPVGNEQVQLSFPGGGHTFDNIIAWIPSENALFGGCILKGLEYRHIGNTADADLDAWPETMNILIDKYSHAQIIIPGHGNIGGPELLTYTQELLKKHLNSND